MGNDLAPETGIGIKKPNAIEQVSDEEFQRRILEIARAKRDIVYWAEKYFYIVTLDKGLQLIKLYDKQKELLKHIIANDRTIVLSARQTGKCVFKDTQIKIRNKHTHEEQLITIEDFFKLIETSKQNNQLDSTEKQEL